MTIIYLLFVNWIVLAISSMPVTRVVDVNGGRLSVVVALHLSDRLGDFAGTHAVKDADWNIHLINNKHFYNSVKFADFLYCMFDCCCCSSSSSSSSSSLL